VREPHASVRAADAGKARVENEYKMARSVHVGERILAAIEKDEAYPLPLPVVQNLLKMWPRQNTEKEELFLEVRLPAAKKYCRLPC